MNTPHPSSVPGDFYVINECCLACGAPQSIAPNLIGTESPSHHCFWKKQPETPAEVDQAIKIILTQELDCHRYAAGHGFCNEDSDHYDADLAQLAWGRSLRFWHTHLK